MENKLDDYTYVDSSALKCREGIFYPSEVFLAKRPIGIFHHSYIKPLPDIVIGDYLKDLSLDKCLEYAPTLDEVNFILSKKLKNEKLISWNAAYELKHFPGLKSAAEIKCLMKETTNYFGIPEDNNGFIKYCKLQEVAELLNIKFGIEGFSKRFNKPHRVVPDVKVLMDIHERYFYRNIRCPVLPPINISLGSSPW